MGSQIKMSEFKSILRKWKRPAILKKRIKRGKRKENWEHQIEKSLNECEDVRNILAARFRTLDESKINNGRFYAQHAEAFVTQPLSKEELDTIKYTNFAMERYCRLGTRPVIPKTCSTNRRKLKVDLSPTVISTEESENQAIVKDFSEFVEVSFNSLSISDEHTLQPNFTTLPEEKPDAENPLFLESLFSNGSNIP